MKSRWFQLINSSSPLASWTQIWEAILDTWILFTNRILFKIQQESIAQIKMLKYFPWRPAKRPIGLGSRIKFKINFIISRSNILSAFLKDLNLNLKADETLICSLFVRSKLLNALKITLFTKDSICHRKINWDTPSKRIIASYYGPKSLKKWQIRLKQNALSSVLHGRQERIFSLRAWSRHTLQTECRKKLTETWWEFSYIGGLYGTILSLWFFSISMTSIARRLSSGT